jgi:hypothetical protein
MQRAGCNSAPCTFASLLSKQNKQEDVAAVWLLSRTQSIGKPNILSMPNFGDFPRTPSRTATHTIHHHHHPKTKRKNDNVDGVWLHSNISEANVEFYSNAGFLRLFTHTEPHSLAAFLCIIIQERTRKTTTMSTM